MTEIQRYIHKATERHNLSAEESARAFQIVMNGGATPAQVAALLVALKMKGETPDEITGGVRAMRVKATPFPVEEKLKSQLVDTCGTGGDGAGTYNISTAVALVLAACGVPVAKHGNRAVSSRSGSADVLKALGVNIDASEALVQKSLKTTGFCFLLAPRYHPALRHVAPTRQELGMRTIFNLLGPLANPAGAQKQLVGVYQPEWLVPMAEVLKNLGSTSAWVVHGSDGLDELTVTGSSRVAILKDGTIETKEVHPEQAGLSVHDAKNLKGGDAEHNASALRKLFGGKPGAYRDIVLLNVAAALVVAGAAEDLKQGASRAAEVIDNGAANQTLDEVVRITNEEVFGRD